ncbi:TonB family protein [Paracoccus marinaquae]|uniref:TonB family protein n=1 Tax=Paracoccus marinaquae TaxID=2841926 RepID=A0ABS6AK35_9RHOB|nr:TonB family protein [Paracoccus marinaquae]MBU3030009.1 TonB family protein [Paracoccus marinaquae]
MARSRSLEIAGFVVIAAALHVSAAAVMLPEQMKRGAFYDAPPAVLAAGSVDMAGLVSEWDAPPEPTTEIVETTPPAPPVEEVQDEAPLSEQPPVVTAMAPPPALLPPETSAVRPNLPEPPAPQPEIVPPELPELQSFSPPEIVPPLRLDASARPMQRPDPKPEPQREIRKQAQPKAEPERQKARTEAPRQPQAAAPSRAGQGGQSAASSSGGGGGGVSAKQRASMQAKWHAQISSCLLRSIARTSGGSGLRATLSVRVGRNGRVQAASVTGSSGQARIDREIARGAQRARCPAAPKELTDASYSFTQPISIR